ncbi:hypothetical protein BDR06DRAFT_1007830 [Suillus hirtellus]|nr:hypothetical protein BDR06DRAFT_1007830 [Suillus hirtellus]
MLCPQHAIELNRILFKRNAYSINLLVNIIRATDLIERLTHLTKDELVWHSIMHLQRRICNFTLCLIPNEVKDVRNKATIASLNKEGQSLLVEQQATLSDAPAKITPPFNNPINTQLHPVNLYKAFSATHEEIKENLNEQYLSHREIQDLSTALKVLHIHPPMVIPKSLSTHMFKDGIVPLTILGTTSPTTPAELIAEAEQQDIPWFYVALALWENTKDKEYIMQCQEEVALYCMEQMKGGFDDLNYSDDPIYYTNQDI